MRTINPDNSFRFSMEYIRDSYDSLEQAFEQGDYNLVAEFAPSGSELEGMGMIMAGLPHLGIPILERLPQISALAGLILSFAYFYLDEEDKFHKKIAALLDQSKLGVAATELLELAQAKQINILEISHPPVNPSQAENETSAHQAAERSYGIFKIRSAATQEKHDYYPSHINTDLAELIENIPAHEKPDIVYCQVPEWFTPRNLDKVNIPKISWQCDHDYKLFRAFDNYLYYDINICCTSQEQFELSQSLGTFCVSRLLCDPFGYSFPPPQEIDNNEKDIAILATGNVFDRFHTEKARFLFSLTRLSKKYKILIHHGHLPYEEYLDVNKRVKISPIISRFCGNPSPRWRAALAKGSLVAYPKHSLFGKVSPNCVSYTPEYLTVEIQDYLDGVLPTNEYAAMGSYSQIYAINDCPSEKRIERHYRYTLFLNILKKYVWQPPVTPAIERKPTRRFVWLMRHVDSNRDNSTIFEKVFEAARQLDEDSIESDIDCNNLAITYIQLGLQLFEVLRNEDLIEIINEFYLKSDLIPLLHDMGFEIFKQGLERFPQSLLLKFNLAHSLLLSQKEKYRKVSLDYIFELFREIVEQYDSLSFEPLGSDIGMISLHFDDPVFPYYEYGGEVVKYAVRTGNPSLAANGAVIDPKRIILAVSYGYMALIKHISGDDSEALKYARKAMDIHDFNAIFYRFKMDILIDLIKKSYNYKNDLDRELIESFFLCVERWPLFIFETVDKVAASFVREDRIDELRAVMKDWYYFAKAMHDNTAKKFIHKNDVAKMLDFQDYLPQPILNALREEPDKPNTSRAFIDRLLVSVKKEKYAGRKIDNYLRRKLSISCS